MIEYQHGYKTKERFWVRGQLFEGKKVRVVRFIQSHKDRPGICKMSIVPQTEKLKNDPPGDSNRHRLLPTATGIPTGQGSRQGLSGSNSGLPEASSLPVSYYRT